MRLTLPYFGFCYRLAHEIFLGALVSAIMVSVVDSELELLLMLGPATYWQSSTPPRAPYVSRIEMRLLRHKEGVKVSVKNAHAFGHVGMTTIRMRR